MEELNARSVKPASTDPARARWEGKCFLAVAAGVFVGAGGRLLMATASGWVTQWVAEAPAVALLIPLVFARLALSCISLLIFLGCIDFGERRLLVIWRGQRIRAVFASTAILGALLLIHAFQPWVDALGTPSGVRALLAAPPAPDLTLVMLPQIVPTSIVGALAENQIAPTIFAGLALGLAIGSLGASASPLARAAAAAGRLVRCILGFLKLVLPTVLFAATAALILSAPSNPPSLHIGS
ncbi:MAG TPA: cation:dicarboxylase symporter family transporter [Allosphingosinicella sp.]|jgi:Na+/H+-dicarboxylate symporter